MEEEALESNGFGWRKLFTFIILVGLLWSIWFIFFSYEKCTDNVCFDDYLKACDNAYYVGGDDMIFEYTIKGKSKGACEVEVELLQGELNNADSIALEKQSMTCMLPLGVAVAPESDIGVCHGLLKEGLQDLVIRKLHTYLVQNLGRLNLEIAGVPET